MNKTECIDTFYLCPASEEEIIASLNSNSFHSLVQNNEEKGQAERVETSFPSFTDKNWIINKKFGIACFCSQALLILTYCACVTHSTKKYLKKST